MLGSSDTPPPLAAVWVGFDEKTSLGKDETGARAALPIWIAFMSKALADDPVEEFRVPAGIVMKKVNIETGLPTDEESSETILEAFVEGMLPEEKEGERKEESPLHPRSETYFQKRVRVTEAGGMRKNR